VQNRSLAGNKEKSKKKFKQLVKQTVGNGNEPDMGSELSAQLSSTMSIRHRGKLACVKQES
jgi:hypothetical protein